MENQNLKSENIFPTINPASEKKLSSIAEVIDDVDKAVKSARRAYDGVWSSMSAKGGKYILELRV